MSDIFLSYASEDRQRVRPLAEALAREGWSVFWDRIIPVGKTWDELLEEELETARSLLVVWSQNSIKSKWVRVEANEGFRRELPFFPVLLDGVLPPLAFRGIQAADFSEWDDSQSSPMFQTLVRDIKNILGPPATPEPEHLEPELTEIKPSGSEPVEPTSAKVEPPVPTEEAGPTEPAAAEPELLAPEPVEETPLKPMSPEVRKGHLWVDTEPEDATVKLVNIQADFAQGMVLESGRYELEVSADGYETNRVWVELGAGEDTHISSKLSPIIASEPAEAVKPETIEPEPSAPEPPEPELVEPKPAEPPKPETPEGIRKNRMMLIGVPAVFALFFLIVGLWWIFSGGQPAKQVELERQPITLTPVEKVPVKSAPLESQSIKSAPVEKHPTKPTPVKKVPVTPAPEEKSLAKAVPMEKQGHVVNVDNATALPAVVAPGQLVKLKMTYTILTPSEVPTSVTVVREVRYGGVLVGQPYQTTVYNNNGTFIDSVEYRLPSNATRGTYTVTERIITKYGSSEKDTTFTVN